VLATPDVADLRVGLQGLVDRLAGGMQFILDGCRTQVESLQARLNRASPVWRLRNDRQRLDELQARIQRATATSLALRRARLETLAVRLAGLNPRLVLQHGYTLVEKPDGTLVHSVTQLQSGEKIRLRLADGQAGATVDQVESL
jgi:exodeoxyribonuclease VII large subunit